MFAITSPDQDGAGKTTLVEAIGTLVNLGKPGAFTVSSGRDFERLVSHLVEPVNESRRLISIDNYKGGTLSGQDIEALITAKEVGGHVLYRGRDRVPNLFVWFLTGNFVEMSKDMSVRTVEIQIKRPTTTADWKYRLLSVDHHRVIGAIGAFFRRPIAAIGEENRWDVWGREVLGRLEYPDAIAKEVLIRQGGLNVVDEEAAELREILVAKLAYHGFDAEIDSVHIPARVLAKWVREELPNRGRAVWTSNAATRFS